MLYTYKDYSASVIFFNHNNEKLDSLFLLDLKIRDMLSYQNKHLKIFHSVWPDEEYQPLSKIKKREIRKVNHYLRGSPRFSEVSECR